MWAANLLITILLLTMVGFKLAIVMSLLAVSMMWFCSLGSDFGKFHHSRSPKEMQQLILGKESV